MRRWLPLTAREYFDSVRGAALARRRLAARLAYLRARDGLKAQRLDAQPRARGAADPMDAVAERMDEERAARRDMAAYDAAVAEGRAVCRGVRAANPSQRWADVLEARYCDLMEWGEVARVSFVSESRARADAAAALDWVDMVGVASAREGAGRSSS